MKTTKKIAKVMKYGEATKRPSREAIAAIRALDLGRGEARAAVMSAKLRACRASRKLVPEAWPVEPLTQEQARELLRVVAERLGFPAVPVRERTEEERQAFLAGCMVGARNALELLADEIVDSWPTVPEKQRAGLEAAVRLLHGAAKAIH